MKRVLIFSLAYHPHVGGAEVSIKEKTERMGDLEFHMVTLRMDKDSPRVSQEGRVLVRRIGFGSKGRLNKLYFQFAAAFVGLWLHRTHHYDCLWAMMVHSSGVPAAIFKWLRPSVPYVLELQEGDPPEYIERLMRPLWPLFSRAFTSASAVSVLSEYLKQWALRRGAGGPVEVIPQGVDTRRFSGDATSHEGVVLVTTSRLVHKNAVDDCIRALSKLPLVRFKIYGTGPDEPALRRLAKEVGVEGRVEFAGHVDNSQLPRVLHEADIFVRPSRSEGFGISFIEAFAAGLPVVATQEGGIADFLFDAKRNPDKAPTGWAVDKDSPEQIARAIEEILSNPAQTQKVVENAKQLVRQKYDWDFVAKQMRERVFSKVLSNQG